MSLIARYDVQAAKLDQQETERHVRETILRLYPDVSRHYVNVRLDYYIAHAADYPLVRLDPIPITAAEVARIAALAGIKQQAMAFACLALAKFNTARSAGDASWIPEARLRETMLRANLQMTNQELYLLLNELYQAGIIGLNRRIDNCDIHVLCIDAEEKSKVVMTLNEQDYKDLGYAWRAYCGAPYIRCQDCGRWIKAGKNGRRKYCAKCAADSASRSKRASKHKSRIGFLHGEICFSR